MQKIEQFIFEKYRKIGIDLEEIRAHSIPLERHTYITTKGKIILNSSESTKEADVCTITIMLKHHS